MIPTTQYIDISTKRMAYYDIGHPDAPVILLGHSFLWNKDMWREQFACLSKEYRLIVPDLWGHGESAGLPTKPTSINMMAEEYYQLMQLLDIEQFSIIGLSVGGMWGTQLALNHPEQVQSLIIMGTYVGAEPQASLQAYMALLDNFKQCGGFNQQIVEATWPYFFAETLPKDSPLIDEMKQLLSSIPKKHVDDIYEIATAIFHRNSNLENLPKLTMPFAIITGEGDIARVSSESEEMAKVANCDHLIYISNAGHISCLENPQQVNQEISDFLSASLSAIIS